MATQREIKRRIKSAKNIGQVTRALEMVSAVKMKKAQSLAAAGRPYTDELFDVMGQLAGRMRDQTHPLMTPAAKKERVLMLIVAPERGLAGPLVSNLTRTVLKEIEKETAEVKLVVWGKKGRNIALKTRKMIVADFSDSKLAFGERINAVVSFLTKEFLEKRADVVKIAYSRFVNTMSQKAEVVPFLPITNLFTKAGESSFIFEPSVGEVLEAVLHQYVERTVTQLVLDNSASEHSARMVAMKNAHENAADISHSLGLLYNKTRQTAITNELAGFGNQL